MSWVNVLWTKAKMKIAAPNELRTCNFAKTFHIAASGMFSRLKALTKCSSYRAIACLLANWMPRIWGLWLVRESLWVKIETPPVQGMRLSNFTRIILIGKWTIPEYWRVIHHKESKFLWFPGHATPCCCFPNQQIGPSQPRGVAGFTFAKTRVVRYNLK